MPRRSIHPNPETAEQIQRYLAAGVSQRAICELINISHDTLGRHYKQTLEVGRDVANARIAAKLYERALTGECPASMFFWLKTRAGWRETQRLQVELSELPDNELIAAAAGIIAGVDPAGSEDGEADSEED